MSTSIPDLHIEQYVLGEAEPSICSRIEQDPELMARVAQLQEQSSADAVRYPAWDMVPQIQRRHGKQAESGNGIRWQISWPKVFLGLGTASALAIVVMAVAPGFLGDDRPVAGQVQEYATGERLKGLETELRVYLRDAGPAAVAREGDTLQISYVAAGTPYGAIFSIDGRGVTTLHWPETEDMQAELEQGTEMPLPYSYILDDAPYFEQFVLVSAQEPLDVESVMDYLSAGLEERRGGLTEPLQEGDLRLLIEPALPPGSGIDTVLVEKSEGELR